jgi:broad specificity phosphatase PhoE
VATTIAMVRHGETAWNRENRFQGHADPRLTAAGRRQAHELARDLPASRFAALYSSPLRRALETAEILGATIDVPVSISESLREVDVGSWQGLTRTEVEARFPGGYRRWLEYGHGWEGGETYDELGMRVVTGLCRIADQHPGDHVLAVTHGGPIRSALAAAAGVSFDEARRSIHVVGNCAIVRIAVRSGVLERVD